MEYVHAVLKRALTQTALCDLVGRRTVAEIADALRARWCPMIIINQNQVRALLESLRDDRLYRLCALALAIGMRQAELLGLRWEDIGPNAAMMRQIC